MSELTDAGLTDADAAPNLAEWDWDTLARSLAWWLADGARLCHPEDVVSAILQIRAEIDKRA